MAFTKAQVDRMTSEEYLHNFNTNPEFRTFVDGGMGSTEVETVEPAIREQRPSPRNRAERTTDAAPTPAFDPSFDDSPNPPAVEAPAIVPAAVIPPAPIAEVPVELPEKVYEYFITDDNGKQIGGKQVFKYRTQDELIDKLRDSNIHVRRMAQKLREEQLLSGTEVPADATEAQVLQLRPRLSADERTAWQEKLQDPSTAAQAQYQLDRDDDRGVQNDLLQSNYESRVLLALESFKNRNRDYVPSQENATKLVGYIGRRGLDPTNARNYQKAYDVLRENGVITDASGNQVTEPVLAPVPPTVREEKTVPIAAPVEAPARISEPAPTAKRTVAPIPTGLSNADSTSDVDNPMPKAHWLTIKQWLKDGKGKPTSQFEEFHDLEAIEHCDDKALRQIISDQSSRGKKLRADWDQAEAEKTERARLARFAHLGR